MLERNAKEARREGAAAWPAAQDGRKEERGREKGLTSNCSAEGA